MTHKLITNAKRDKLLTRCESLILQGYDSISEVSERLDISFNTARSYITLIKERWSSGTNIEELQGKRQELIKKVEAVIKEAFILKSKAKNTLEATSALRTILMAVERLEKLQGIDSLPLPLEKPREVQIFEWAQTINRLPSEQKDFVMKRVRKEIDRRIKDGEVDNSFMKHDVRFM